MNRESYLRAFGEYFDRAEFACKCGCGFDVVDAELLEALQAIRAHYLAPVIIHSGCRCSPHNFSVGGSEYSQHVLGKAVDFSIPGIQPQDIAAHLVMTYPTSCGIGLYNSWVHFDVRDTFARWGFN